MNSYTTGWVSATCQTHPLPELPHGLRKWIFLIHQEGLEPQRNCFGRPSTPAGKWRSEGGTHTVYPEPLAGGGGGDGSQVCPPHSPMALHRSRILRAGFCPPWPAPPGEHGGRESRWSVHGEGDTESSISACRQGVGPSANRPWGSEVPTTPPTCKSGGRGSEEPACSRSPLLVGRTGV